MCCSFVNINVSSVSLWHFAIPSDILARPASLTCAEWNSMCRYFDIFFKCEIVFPRANAPASPMQLLSMQTSFNATIDSQYAKPSTINEKESYDNLQCDHISNENI